MFTFDDIDRAMAILGRVQREIEHEAEHVGETLLAQLLRAGVDPAGANEMASAIGETQDDPAAIRHAWLLGLMTGALLRQERQSTAAD